MAIQTLLTLHCNHPYLETLFGLHSWYHSTQHITWIELMHVCVYIKAEESIGQASHSILTPGMLSWTDHEAGQGFSSGQTWDSFSPSWNLLSLSLPLSLSLSLCVSITPDEVHLVFSLFPLSLSHPHFEDYHGQIPLDRSCLVTCGQLYTQLPFIYYVPTNTACLNNLVAR